MEKAKEMKEAAVAIDVKFKDLRVAVVALNDSKLLKEKIKIVGVSQAQILKDFRAAIDSIPDGPDGKFPGPKASIDFYNKILDLEEEAKKKAVEGAAGAGKTEDNATGKGKGKSTPTAKGKGGGKTTKEKGEGTGQTDFIRKFIIAGNKRENVIKKLAEQFKWDEKRATARLVVYEKAYGEMGKDDKKVKK